LPIAFWFRTLEANFLHYDAMFSEKKVIDSWSLVKLGLSNIACKY